MNRPNAWQSLEKGIFSKNGAKEVEELKDAGVSFNQRDGLENSFGYVENGTANFPSNLTKTEKITNILQTPATKLSQD